jgi:hypothetical protein
VAQNSIEITNLKAEVHVLADRLNEVRASEERQTTALSEIETQFCASDIIRNLMHANEMRIESLLWQRTFKETIPTDNAYYPMVCNRPPAK